ncbi:MAG: sigma 54-interacting transcriptional regulator, partial [Kiritimatiellae bacterium]|nr:sigma 54-interacting transcriptional regulator [Kiritimatiellia bacterium]
MNDAQMDALVQLSSELVGTLDEKAIIQKIVKEAASVLDAQGCSVILIDEATDECYFYGASNASSELLQIHFNRELGVVGKVLSTGEPVLVADASREPSHYAGVDRRTGITTESLLAVPLMVRGRLIGVVEAVNKRASPSFSESDLHLLSIFANFAAVALHNARAFGQCRNEAEAFRAAAVRPDIWMGGSSAMKRVWSLVSKVGQTASTVLISGESGCGKEVVADAIHRAGDRRDRPCICVNCAALDPNLLASELFGHEKGAFTGAHAQRIGRFELAKSGTIFLDEIGDAEWSVQARLLRVLETHRYERLGSSESRFTDARVIAATNVNLEEAVREKRFREDLFHRLNVVSIVIPPLREHLEDVPGMLDFFAERCAREMKAQPIRFAPDAVAALAAYGWPGNIRELKNVVERCAVLADGAVIGARELRTISPLADRRSPVNQSDEKVL